MYSNVFSCRLFILLLLTSACAACNVGKPESLHQCSDFSDTFSCESISGPVCARVDTGMRCIRAPCDSYAKVVMEGACQACTQDRVDLVFTGRCDAMDTEITRQQKNILKPVEGS